MTNVIMDISTGFSLSVRILGGAPRSLRPSLQTRDNLPNQFQPGANFTVMPDGSLSFAGLVEGHYMIAAMNINAGSYITGMKQGDASILENGVITVGPPSSRPVEKA